MQTNIDLSPPSEGAGHLVRPRVNALLEGALRVPLVIVCAGAGYGKTRAVYDFIRKNRSATIWVQVSKQDNVVSRFWESFVRAVAQLNKTTADEFKNLGFPDTEEKMQRYVDIRNRALTALGRQRSLMVLDDFHLIENPDIIAFIERFLQSSLENRSIILITRENPRINISELRARNHVHDLQEEELRFTENELTLYLQQQNIAVTPRVLREISRDTDGWAFAISLVARSLRRAPGYSGYARSAMKKNIFELMSTETLNLVSEQLQRFLVCLSLIEHLSEDLVRLLARGDEDLLAEFGRQSAYLRYDPHLNAWLIHPLFLDFLRSRHDILTDDERRWTYQTAGSWCEENDYLVDALNYYEAAGDYDAIVNVLSDLPFYLPYDLALHVLEIFKRSPEEALLHTDFLAVMYLRTLLSLGRSQEFNRRADYFEEKFLERPKGDLLRKHTLGLIYCFQGMMRHLMSTADGVYDFNRYFSKMHDCLKDRPLQSRAWLTNDLGPWVSLLGSNKPEALQAYTEASAVMINAVGDCIEGVMAGLSSLCRGELTFYQDGVREAELLILKALTEAREARQFETLHRALFYVMRSAFTQGKRERAEQALRDIEALLDEKDYAQRFMMYDIAQGWYAYLLQQPDLVPGWLKEEFSPYGHAFFSENFGNQMKARFHFMTRNFTPLLVYIDEMKQRESILFGRIEMQALEACAYYQMKDRKKALAALREAWELVASNSILMPFIELGKDMRTLSACALRDPDCGIPTPWLEAVNRRSSLYARYQAMMIADYETRYNNGDSVALSFREAEVLQDLYAGLSRADISVKQDLSLSTVNMHVKGLYTKLRAKNVADVIRTAVEQKLV
ncbi:MAG: LuxR C-terminal-related transcriptional regulator [Actinomycetia bacterium]|nr:LuxR C-terminal-related transcriptional regulator [Actinomycetes bacterium]